MSISSPSPFSPPHIRSRAILAALGWTIVILGVAGINWVMIESEMQKVEHAGGGASTPIIISSNILRSFSTNNILGYGAVWLVGMAGIYIASRKLNQAIVERDAVISSAQASEMRLRAISDNLMDAALYVYTLDEQNQPRFEYVSAGIEVLTGVCVEDILNDPQKLRRGILPKYQVQLDALEKKSREGLTRFELEFQHNNEITGKTRWSLMRATPYRRLDGSIYWYTVMVDITTKKRNEEAVRIAHEQLNTHMQEIEKLHEKLREQAFLDPLTGLNNRRYLSERMTGEIARADRENACLSILIADIDHFKNINDTYGHQVGDKFLVEIAGLLKNHTRGSDIVCRYGGEEFMMVLPGTIAEVAVQRAESLREMCTSIRIPYEDQELKVTLSFGVAAYPVHGKDAEEVILKADKAMYRSKSDGRNRVTLWKE